MECLCCALHDLPNGCAALGVQRIQGRSWQSAGPGMVLGATCKSAGVRPLTCALRRCAVAAKGRRARSGLPKPQPWRDSRPAWAPSRDRRGVWPRMRRGQVLRGPRGPRYCPSPADAASWCDATRSQSGYARSIWPAAARTDASGGSSRIRSRCCDSHRQTGATRRVPRRCRGCHPRPHLQRWRASHGVPPDPDRW